MYDREAIRAPSVARYALGVAVACERREATLLFWKSRGRVADEKNAR